MNTPKLNTTYTFTFCDGTTATMTLTFYALYRLKSNNKALYDRYNRTMQTIGSGKGDELDSLTLLYIAYVCANANDDSSASDLMSEEEFIIKCGSDREAIGKAAQALTAPKN